ncbi:MAG: cupredoxin domain-containing protein [Chloroflexi bacterium]|nr:cupredoxin domain-containing protein [Chloroflexota bacterium]
MAQLQAAWTSILDILAKLVIPDWGGLIALIPVGLAAIVVLWLLMVVRAYATVGPRERGMPRRDLVPPSGVHMPGPSFAPSFAAVGAALLFFGFVWGGAILLLGFGALVLTLLYWLREGMLDYDRVAGVASVPAVVGGGGPPAGVHMPGPSFLPLVSAVSAAILFAGFVLGGWVLIAAVLCLVIGLLGWLRTAGVEYHLTEEADRTGHLRNAAAPRFPARMFASFTVILLVAAAFQTGIFPPANSSAGAAAPGASAGPGASGTPASPSAVAADVAITAQNISFTTPTVTAPAGRPFTIAFQNLDSGTPHNVTIRNPNGSDAFDGAIVTGVITTLYQVPALAAGTYTFFCKVHTSMTGTITVR